MRGLEAPHDSPAEGRLFIDTQLCIVRHRDFHPSCLPETGVSSFEKKVLFLCATRTLAVRDTEVQSTGRSLRMRTWVGPGALCMHERASRVSHISLPQDCSNTCSERVWLALHLATPKVQSLLAGLLSHWTGKDPWVLQTQVV